MGPNWINDFIDAFYVSFHDNLKTPLCIAAVQVFADKEAEAGGAESIVDAG
ncbi:MAG: hypothetical protein R3336_02500 [Phycisphaeraceae bacterium]|nr:hypothetical protein [Phycisphaeraceae bacterium]